ncbi:hypothetical protein OHR01_002765 [Salmonella enterica]|nr:hypothetical protein [Salmonella enterica]EKG3677374.1 hypothetical protein [Salmonella enterica]
MNISENEKAFITGGSRALLSDDTSFTVEEIYFQSKISEKISYMDSVKSGSSDVCYYCSLQSQKSAIEFITLLRFLFGTGGLPTILKKMVCYSPRRIDGNASK